MNAQTAKALKNLPRYAAALARHFDSADSFTSREYDEVREHDHDLPMLSTLRKNKLVKLAEKEEFEVTVYTFKIKGGYSGRYIYTENYTEAEATKRGLKIEDATQKETHTGTRFYYQLDEKAIQKAKTYDSRLEEYAKLTVQIEALEAQLEQLTKMRRDL